MLRRIYLLFGCLFVHSALPTASISWAAPLPPDAVARVTIPLPKENADCQLVLSGDGKRLAAFDGSKGRLSLWDTEDGKQKQSWDIKDSPSVALALSFEEALLAISSPSPDVKCIQVFDATTKRRLWNEANDKNAKEACFVAFNVDGLPEPDARRTPLALAYIVTLLSGNYKPLKCNAFCSFGAIRCRRSRESSRLACCPVETLLERTRAY